MDEKLFKEMQRQREAITRKRRKLQELAAQAHNLTIEVDGMVEQLNKMIKEYNDKRNA